MDEVDYHFLTAPGAALQVSIAGNDGGKPELRLFGNRAGVLTLANILLWLVANAQRREFLSLGQLGFVELAGLLSVCLRLIDEEPTRRDGRVVRLDRAELLEWSVSEDDLRRVALGVHRLACNPGHEYDRLLMGNDAEFEVQIRMTDAEAWLATGIN
jgi:hypothetical protein